MTVRGNEAYIVGMFIPPYQTNNTPKEYDPNRNRRLLLKKKEIMDLGKVEGTKGLTIVPISVYNKGVKLKVKIGVARGRKKYDKRATRSLLPGDRAAGPGRVARRRGLAPAVTGSGPAR